MPLFEIAVDGLVRREVAGFAALGLYERSDLQRLLRGQPTALGEDLLIVGEEFGDWEDSRRRIDLLAVDRDAHLVVIELKRTDDGGHMNCRRCAMRRWCHR
jgi:RecB family endonuclease NucS